MICLLSTAVNNHDYHHQALMIFACILICLLSTAVNHFFTMKKGDCILMLSHAVKKKIETKTLLDTTRSRNIEIFLPSFPFSLDSLQSKLSDQLNNVIDSPELGIDHIVALKR